MKYAEPYILLLIPAVFIALIFFYLWAARRKKQLLNSLLGSNAADPDSLHLSQSSRLWKFILRLCAASFIICGAARPYLKKIPVPVNSSGRDVIVLFDVSKSMRATDLPPSRMEHAKFLLRRIIKDLPGDRFGLIAFAGNAFLSCPLTADTAAFNEYINDLDTDTVPLGGTNIERALLTAERAFKGAENSSLAVLMLTDGDALSGNAARVVEKFKSAGIPLVIAGMGDPAAAAPVPDGKGGFVRGSDGKVAASRLNENELSRLAAETGGVYVRSTVGDTGAAAIETALKRLTAQKREHGKSFQIDEKFPWFFAAGFILLLTACFISEAPGRKSAVSNGVKKVGALILFLSALSLYGEAVSEKTAEKLPEDAMPLYNLARERQQNGDASALPLYEEVIRKAQGNRELQSRALHNLGVGSHLEGRSLFEKARQCLARQQLDKASEELDLAKAKYSNSNDLYTQVLSVESSVIPSAGTNLRQLELDKQQLEKLKKQIEELKKQQQNARQQTQNARNQQKKNQQQNRQNQENKNSPQQNQQNNQPNSSQQTRQAAQAASRLEKQAADLKQDKLRQDAANARKELEKAAEKQENNGSQQEIEKHLEQAEKLLGKPEKDSDKKGDEKSGKSGKDKEKEQNSAQSAAEAEQRRREEEKRAGETQLQMLNDESSKLRRNLRQRNLRGTPQSTVEKDW